jgi:hypothetical protein
MHGSDACIDHPTRAFFKQDHKHSTTLSSFCGARCVPRFDKVIGKNM